MVELGVVDDRPQVRRIGADLAGLLAEVDAILLDFDDRCAA